MICTNMVINRYKLIFYKLTHSILCFIGLHRVIHWDQNSKSHKDGNPCDYQCWCSVLSYWYHQDTKQKDYSATARLKVVNNS